VCSATGCPSTGPSLANVVDPFHCNSIDVEPTTGNLLVSARNMDSVFFIDWTTGAVLWKMGGKAYNKDGATVVPIHASHAFYRQHDVRLQPGWSTTDCGGKGQISMYDDETDTGYPARAVVWDVTVSAGDAGGGEGGGACGTAGATVAWQYEGPGETGYMGSFRILSDGSRVVGWGCYGDTPSGLVFTELSDAGADLLDFYFTDTDCSYRAIKVPTTQLDISAMRNAVGL
jgi:hypothetical protein